MDSLVVFGALALLAIPILLIVFMVWTVQLGKRVAGLEKTITRLQSGQAPPTAAPAAPEAPPPVRPADTAPGPWVGAVPETPQPGERPHPPRAVVLRAETFAALSDWLKANWVYAVSAVSLAAAGLFFVQYGIEAGLLPPPARVVAALAFGLALVVAGEVVRRRWGDRAEATTAYLPSVFSGAGIVTLFGALLSALHLYGLISPPLAFAGLAAVAALAIGLGWYSGPLLAAIGVAGAMTAPFLVGGDSAAPEVFYGYFALVILTGLAIDAGRRWAWVSLLSLGLAYPAGWLLYLGSGGPEFFAAYLTLMVLASIAIPTLTLTPRHDGAALIEAFARPRPRGWPGFPTRLVAGSMAASVASLALISTDAAGAFWATLPALAVLFLAIAFWADRAEALEDLAVLPAAALLALPLLQALDGATLYRGFQAVLTAEEGTPVPLDPYLVVAAAALLGLIAAWRSRRGARWPVAWAAGAAAFAPLMLGLFEAFWRPAEVYGAYPWALAALTLAGLMTAQALAFARADGAGKARIAGFALAALAMIALALTLVLTATALTLALAVVTLAAALLDRRFDLRPLAAAVQVGALALGWRLLVDPGLPWAAEAPFWELSLAFGGTVAMLTAGLWALRPRPRPAAHAVLESAAVTLGATFLSLLLVRAINEFGPGYAPESHWVFGLTATIWLAAALGQLWRSQVGGWLRRLRLVLAGLYGLLAALLLGAALSLLNPAFSADPGTRVLGPPLVNTLAAAYLLPALLLGLSTRLFTFLGKRLRLVLAGLGGLLGLVWTGLAIRHAWQGDTMYRPGFTEPELYSYTIALLVLGGGLLWQALSRRAPALRKLAMAVIALTVAKVFLVDASGLVGLLRVFSFLALGLSLAGLAFVNRWAAARTGQGGGE